VGRVRARIVSVPDDQTVVLEVVEPAPQPPRSVPMTDIRDARLAVDW
jgi:hypothetical protein